jgi:hypothetical protein
LTDNSLDEAVTFSTNIGASHDGSEVAVLSEITGDTAIDYQHPYTAAILEFVGLEGATGTSDGVTFSRLDDVLYVKHEVVGPDVIGIEV